MMSKSIFAAVSLFLVPFLSCASNISAQVDHIINSIDPNINMGIEVFDLNSKQTLYKRNADVPLIPASNMKLFSDAAALMALGADYRFETTLSTNAKKLDNGVLHGSLFLHLSGDPSLTHGNIAKLLSSLGKWGVKAIDGDVVIVAPYNNVAAYAPGHVLSDHKYSYGAPVAPLVLDENRLSVTINPGYKVGEKAYIETDSQLRQTAIQNEVKTVANGSKCGVSLSIVNSTLVARGCIGSSQWAIQQRIPIVNPVAYMEYTVKALLKDLKIQLKGSAHLGNAANPKLLLATHYSKPISQLMADTLKPSDNLYADSLFLKAAAVISGKPLNWPDAHIVIKNFLQQKTGISLKNTVFIDGSGLSRQDRVSASQTVELLKFLHTNFPLAYEYIQALPIAGTDGTLRKRFRKPNQKGLLRAKTGTMTGIMSLSGYLYTANGHTLAFAIYINKRPKTPVKISGRYRSLMDSLCDYFLRQSPDNGHALSKLEKKYLSLPIRVTKEDAKRRQYGYWRSIESNVKHGLQGQPVIVLFRNDQLVLKDKTQDVNRVLNVLRGTMQKYKVAVALRSNNMPASVNNIPLLWIKSDNHNQRIWILRTAVF